MIPAIILCAGKGRKIWPYASVRPKPLVPLANEPVLLHLVNTLKKAGIQRIVVSFQDNEQEYRLCLNGIAGVELTRVVASSGTADTLLKTVNSNDTGRFFVFYGDTVIHTEDVRTFVQKTESESSTAVLLSRYTGQDPGNWLLCTVRDGKVADILGHPRDTGTHRFAGFIFNRASILPFLESAPGYFPDVQAGMMPPEERYLEAALSRLVRSGISVEVVETSHPFFDIDKPWHILHGNEYLVRTTCGALPQTPDSAKIDKTACITGNVLLGEGSSIGKNVVVNGSIKVGRNTRIDNGAIIDGEAVIGDNCVIEHYCYIGGGSSIGNSCVIRHCAEFTGILLEQVYLYHYMEMQGIIGTNTDVGAATVCGDMRFDDGTTAHHVFGRREHPGIFANAIYLGDYCRTGVNAVLMPGTKTGVYSIIGPGVVFSGDLPERTMVTAQQELTYTPWGPERYGW